VNTYIVFDVAAVVHENATWFHVDRVRLDAAFAD
jgi:hypothetical protein